LCSFSRNDSEKNTLRVQEAETEFDIALENARLELDKLPGVQLQHAKIIDSVLLASLADHFEKSGNVMEDILRLLKKYYSKM